MNTRSGTDVGLTCVNHAPRIVRKLSGVVLVSRPALFHHCGRTANVKRIGAVTVAVAALLAAGHGAAAETFSFTFEWGAIPRCNDGYPNRVPSPVFTLGGVPGGTAMIEFQMVDRDAPGYYHGGGSVRYSGQRAVAAGAFEYKSPCPPGGTHTYEWTGVAKDGSGRILGEAKASRRYPE
jgi:hypothetical protein